MEYFNYKKKLEKKDLLSDSYEKFRRSRKKCEEQLNMIPEYVGVLNLSEQINIFHPCIQSAINSALAEINGKIIFQENYFFDEIDKTAILLNPNNVISDLNEIKKNQSNIGKSVTIKWKVALKNNNEEEAILEEILSQIGNNIKLRIDANGSWGREMAKRWADILKDNKNIDWLEQPLSVDDIDGLKELNKKIPIALDESLLKFPTLIDEWKGWQIRRAQEYEAKISSGKIYELAEVVRDLNKGDDLMVEIGRAHV